MSNITTKTNRLSVANRKTIINNAVCNSAESVITAIREMGINNPIETENAWKIFCDESGTFHTQLLKNFLFEKGFMTLEQKMNEKCTVKEIAFSVLNCMKSGYFPIKATKQTGIIGYSPIRLSRDFSGKMRGKWAFSTLSLINPFCIARKSVTIDEYMQVSQHAL